MKKTLLFLFFILDVVTPENTFSSNKYLNQIDSISIKTYDELIQIIYDQDIDENIKEFYVNIFDKKAKSEKGSKINRIRRIAEAFRNRSYLASIKKDDFLEIAYLDSIIDFTKDKNVWNYPSFAYYVKGLTLYDRKDFQNSLDNFIQAHKFSKRNNNLDLLYDVKYSIATLKSRVGEQKEALEIFKECYDYAKIQLNRTIDKKDFIVILQALSDEYRRNKKIDSSTLYNFKGIKITSKENYQDYSGYFIFSEGINHFERGNYKASMDSINKSIPLLKVMQDNSNLAFAYLYLGRIYQNSFKEKSTLKFYKKVDSLFEKTKYTHPDLRKVYEYFIDYYKSNNDKNSQLVYTEKLIKVDEILIDDYKYISKNLVKKFDTPELIASQKKLIGSVNKERKELTYIVFALVFLSTVFSVVMFINIRKKRKYRKKVEDILKSNDDEVVINDTKKGDADIGVPLEIIDSILNRLKKFEQDQEFVEKKLTLTLLAKRLNTNTKYLSKVVNYHNKKSFINYINSLRVDYAIEKIKDNKKYRNYTIKAISSDVGFKNPESFSQAFFKNKGVYPSFFIKEYNKTLEEKG